MYNYFKNHKKKKGANFLATRVYMYSTCIQEANKIQIWFCPQTTVSTSSVHSYRSRFCFMCIRELGCSALRWNYRVWGAPRCPPRSKTFFYDGIRWKNMFVLLSTSLGAPNPSKPWNQLCTPVWNRMVRKPATVVKLQYPSQEGPEFKTFVLQAQKELRAQIWTAGCSHHKFYFL